MDKNKIKETIEYLWYSTAVHLAMLVIVYIEQKTVENLIVFSLSIPLTAYMLHKVAFHFTKAKEEMKKMKEV